HGDPTGRPYFSIDGANLMTGEVWEGMRYKFHCPHGFTNVWERKSLHCAERVRAVNGKAAHLNQKPLDLMSLIIKASSDEGDVVWEPFGGLFSGSMAASECGRKAYAGE